MTFVRRVVTFLAGTLAALSASAPAQAQTASYVASSKGSVYYWVGCSAVRRLPIGNRVYFPTPSAADAAGYKLSKSRGCGGPAFDSFVAASIEEGERCVVERVVDGDSFHCSRFGSIRLLLIDTPEPKQVPYGAIAKRYAERLLGIGDTVTLEFDVSGRDRYGRVLAYVYDDRGKMINRELARAGVALLSIYPPNVKYVEVIRAAVDSARAEKRELWSSSAFDCKPVDFRAGRCR